MEGLIQETRQFLAWKSVVRDHEALNLDAHKRREAADGEKQSNDAVTHRVDEAWRWLLAPTQHVFDEGVSGLDWIVEQIAGGADGVAVRASQRMVSTELLITRWSPALLKMELDRWFWKGRNHVPARQVWNAMCAYSYLPRLRDESVLDAHTLTPSFLQFCCHVTATRLPPSPPPPPPGGRAKLGSTCLVRSTVVDR